MNRKLVKHGEATLMVSLPAKWLRQQNLGKGDEISVDEEKNKLVLSSSSISSKKKIKRIYLKDSSEFMSRLLFMNYVRGYDEIHIKFDDNEVLDKIRDCAEELIGFEIIEESENHCLLKNIAIELEFEFDTMLKKLFQTIGEQALKSYEYLKTREFKKISNLRRLGKMGNKYSYFCLRIINNSKTSSISNLSEMHTILWYLEQMSDIYSDICRFVPNEVTKDTPIQKNVLELYKNSYDLFWNTYELLYSQSQSKTILLFRQNLENARRLREKINPVNKVNNFIFYTINQLFMLSDHLSVLLYDM
jgi:phosphate uptake regulator